MKKTLLLASAAVLFAGSASAMEKGLELGIEGYASVYGVYADQDGAGANRSEFEIKKEVELDFTGEVSLENGLTIGATVELQQNLNEGEGDDAGEDVQESHIFVEGGFGKVIVGQEYNAAYLMQVAAPAVDAQFDGMDPTFNVVTTGTNLVLDQSYDMSAQSRSDIVGTDRQNQPVGDKITYITPIWEGLQAGVSYTPDQSVIASRGELSGDSEEAFAVAARWAVDFWDTDWTFGAGYNKSNAGSGNLIDDSYEQYNVAVLAEWDAWDFGVAYYGSKADLAAGGDADEMAIAAGVNYETGNFNYGLSYLLKEVGDDDDLNRFMGGVNYTYGPGMTLNGSVSYNDYGADATAQENEATVVAIGTVINF